MIATSEDVARRAGVSRATVSQILNGRGERFAAETRDRVEQAALDLGYQPSVAARTLARGSSDVVIALIPNTTFGGNLQDLFQTLTDELARRGLTLVLRLSTPSTASLDRVITGMQPRAVLSLTPFSADERALLESREVEAIDPATTARSDLNREIGAMQARHLIDRGYRRLAYAHLEDAREDPFGQGREAGFRDACLAQGIADPAVVRLDVDPDDALTALDRLGGPGIAIGCYNDDVATALLYAATVREWRIPEDVAIIGMDHTPLSAVTIPPLTTIDYDVEGSARAAIDGILARLDAEHAAAAPAEIELRLIERATT